MATPLRRNLILLAVLAAAAAAVALTVRWQQQVRDEHIAACRQQRSAIAKVRRDSFDAQLARMRKMRLNPEQAATLRRVEPEAFARYAQAFGEQVDRVAQAADQLAAQVDAYRTKNCLAVE
ncbi:hypothetical protein NZK33_08085 [Cyanobium sp. FGCU-6]|jgi:hypothetical protein|nr:hypothetical protein [Cyanobium sp. FGCU6]